MRAHDTVIGSISVAEQQAGPGRRCWPGRRKLRPSPITSTPRSCEIVRPLVNLHARLRVPQVRDFVPK